MKKLFTLAIFLGLAFTGFSCGGGGGGGSSSSTPSDPPTISNLRSATSVGLNSGTSGVVPLAGSVDFTDAGGNLSTYTVTVFTAAGSQVSTVTNSASSVGTATSGPLDIIFDVNTTALGSFTFQVFVTDARGAKSNTLSGSFAVRDISQAKAAMPTARDGLVAAAVNNKIYAIGGNAASPPFLNVNEEYDVLANTWSVKNHMPTARSETAVAVVDGKVYVIGGLILDSPFFVGTVEVYDPVTDSWDTTRTAMPTARGEIAAAVVDGKIYVIGGHNFNPGGFTHVVTSLVEVYDPATDTWSTGTPMPTARAALAAVVVNGRIYAIGGGSATGPSFSDKVEEFDPVANTWATKAPLPTPRYDLGAEVVSGKIYTFGGFSGGISSGTVRSHDIVEEYDPATNAWKAKVTLFPPGRHDLAVAVVNGKIYVIGGEAQTARYLAQVDEYNPANDI